MIDGINDRLTEIRKKKNHLKNLNSTLEDLRKQHSTQTVLRKKSKRVLEEAFIDYQKIKNFTLTSLFYSILGKKKERLNKNKQDYLSAKLNLSGLEEELEMIKSQLDKTQVEINKFQNVEFEYQVTRTKNRNLLNSLLHFVIII